MMKRVLNWVVVLPLAVVLIVLAVANRTPVTLSLDPLGRDGSGLSMTLPLFVPMFAALLFGILWGGLVSWLRHRPARVTAKRASSDLDSARGEVERLRMELARSGTTPPSDANVPALFDRTAS